MFYNHYTEDGIEFYELEDEVDETTLAFQIQLPAPEPGGYERQELIHVEVSYGDENLPTHARSIWLQQTAGAPKRVNLDCVFQTSGLHSAVMLAAIASANQL